MKRRAVRDRTPAAAAQKPSRPPTPRATAQDLLGNQGVLSAVAAEREAEGVATAAAAGRAPATAPGALASSSSPSVGAGVRRRIADAGAEGWPLPAPHRALLGDAGATVEDARIHTGARSGRLAADLGAAAFTSGRDVFFAPGRWSPGTHSGRRLLAHELTHVAQQRRFEAGRHVQRQELAPRPVSSSTPPQATISVTLSGLVFVASPDARLGAGSLRTQYMSVLLFRLLGEQYSPILIEPALAHMADFGMSFTGSWADPATAATPGEPYGAIALAPNIASELLRYLEARGLELQVTKEQRELLERGLGAEAAWYEIKALDERMGPLIPAWFTQAMFDRAVAQRQELFERYRRLLGAEPAKWVDEWRLDALLRLAAAIDAAARPLDDIREDVALARDENVGPVYRALWRVDQPDPKPADPAPVELANEELAASFVTWVVTQEELAERSGVDHAVRVELLERFGNWVSRAVTALGDEALTERPTKATDPPFDGRLTSSPSAQPPLYELSSEADAHFYMHIHFPDVYDAFGYYVFEFRRVQLDDVRPLTDEGVAGRGPSVDVEVARKKIAELEAGRFKPREMPGEQPETDEVWTQRLERVARYNAADVEMLTRELGPVGIPLALGNNGLRYVGAGIRMNIEILTSPKRGNRAAALVNFPEPGLYAVFCVAAQMLRGGEEVARPPTVAYIPVLARPTHELAEARAVESRATEETYAELLPELRALRKLAWLPPDKLKPFKDLEDEIVAQQGGIGKTLELELKRLNDALDEIKNLSYHPKRAALREELQRTTDLLTIRAARLTEAQVSEAQMKPLHVSFVSFEGHTIPLRMEWTRTIKPFGSTNQHVYVSDLTTPRSGKARGEAASVEDAIVDAVTKLLKAPEGYGRGIAAISFGKDKVRRIPIDDVGLDSLLSEAIDNISMVLSLAALAAAPFTGGASLVVMIPVGLVGAGTSAYRLLRRDEMGTLLRLDREAAMDILNIVSGAMGVLRPAAAGLRLARFGTVLAVVGVGADKGGILLMGAELVEQIERARNLPPEERDAELLMVLGNGFLQAGMLVGGELAEAAVTERASKLRKKRGGSEEADPKRTRTEPEEKGPPAGREKTMAGHSQPEGHPSTPEPGGGRRPHGVAEDPLLEALARQGVRRDRRPPGATPMLEPHSTFEKGIKSFDEALKIFNVALDEAGGYEVAILQNTSDGTYAVRVGDHTGVRAPNSDPHWQTRLHYHPNPDSTTRFWLPAPHDFAEMIDRFDPDGPPQREMLQYEIPGVGRGLTEFGITPGAEKPFYVKIHLPDGSINEMRFAHDGKFDAHWGSETIYVDPKSPLGKAMGADVDSFFKGIDRAKLEKTMAGSGRRKSGPPPAAGTPVPVERKPELQDPYGQLTQAGLDWVKNLVGYAGMTDETQIRGKFANDPAAREALVLEMLRRGSAEDRSRSVIVGAELGREAYVEPPAGAPKKGRQPEMPSVLTAIEKLFKKAGRRKRVNRDWLEKTVAEVVKKDKKLRKLKADYEKHPDPAVRRAWEWFWWGATTSKPEPGEYRPMDRDYAGKKLKDMRPDAVKISLDLTMPVEVIDATLRVDDPFHGFKTELYAAVIRLATGMDAKATDFLAALKQSPQ